MPAENLVLTLCGRENRSHPFWPNTSKPRRVCQADFDRFRKRDLILEFLWNLELVPLSVLSAASCSKSMSICPFVVKTSSPGLCCYPRISQKHLLASCPNQAYVRVAVAMRT